MSHIARRVSNSLAVGKSVRREEVGMTASWAAHVRGAVITGAACTIAVLSSGTAQAQLAVVNCGMFQNPYDQARCSDANRRAAQVYYGERAATAGYYAARGTDLYVGRAVRAVPYGPAAYGAGRYVGNYWATHPQTGHAWAPPPIRYPYPNIHAGSGEGGQCFRLKADSDSGRSRTAFR